MNKVIILVALVLNFSFVAVNGFASVMYDDFDKYKTSGKSKTEIAAHVVANENFNKQFAILIDMSLPSSQKRLFVIDVKTQKVVYETWASHGRGSGTGAYATQFSDVEGSYCTSLRMYKIGEEYEGKHGKSYRLDGLESTNGNAYDRAVVIHSATYVSYEVAKTTKRVGNSHGCPAISEQALEDMQPYLKEGTLLWIYNN